MTEFPFLGELSLKATNSGACCHSILGSCKAIKQPNEGLHFFYKYRSN